MSYWRLDLHFEDLNQAKAYFEWLELSTYEEIRVSKRTARRVTITSVELDSHMVLETLTSLIVVAYMNFTTIKRATMEKVNVSSEKE